MQQRRLSLSSSKGRSQQQPPSHGPSLTNGAAPTSLTSGAIPAQTFPPTSPGKTPVSFTAEQIGFARAKFTPSNLHSCQSRGQPAHTEKEEQKRIERLAKERLKALKADDEEAYMKLIDTAKDTRITHLLRQTDAYFDSLAQAVVAQQNEGGPMHETGFEQEEGPANEATFGAQINADDAADSDDDKKEDYYAVTHRISEKVTRQPNILVGGNIKDYQVKGLQWMVSLYKNRLNGILADEMVSFAISFEF